MSVKRSALHSWQQFKQEYDEEQEYLAAERAGVRLDSPALECSATKLPAAQGINRDLQTAVTTKPAEDGDGTEESKVVPHALKVEEYWYKFSLADPVYSLIRLKGRWLAKIFPTNSRVIIEEGEDCVTIRKQC